MATIATLGRAACAVTAGITLALTTVSPASAVPYYGDCYFRQSAGHWYCSNAQGAPVYYQPNAYGGVAGYMFTNPSWFYCRFDGGGYIGGPHPNRWLATVADNGRSGYMRDTDIYSETNPVPSC